MQTQATPNLRAIMRDLADRAMSIRREQADVPPSRYDMALRKDRMSVVQATRLARRIHGPTYDARFPD